MDTERFQWAKEELLKGKERNGIGTLGEKTIHAVLKRYYEPHSDQQEVSLGGFVADAVGEDGIYEIQTRQFRKLIPKLEAFLPVCRVTVVYPLVMRKRLNWIDPQSGEVVQQGRWFRCGNRCSFFREAYEIKRFLRDERLSVRIVELTAEEYRFLNGYGQQKKIRAEKYDRIPQELLQEWVLENPSDYAALLPELPKERFGSADLARCARIPRSLAQTTLNVLTELGVVERTGKNGNAYFYRFSCNCPKETLQ